jgi:uncharacterized protein (TIGR01777 family)
MRIAVSGSSGLIGSALVPALRGAGHEVVRLVRRVPGGPDEVRWDPVSGAIDSSALEGIDAAVNVAGYNLGRRWTEARKRTILESRVDSTRVLAETLASLTHRPQVLVCASAIGYYGDRGDEILTEAASPGTGFLTDVVTAWEAAADPARTVGIRVAHLRQGLVLTASGGALRRLLIPARLGLAGRIGSGRQWWSWVALDDVVRAYLHVLERPLAGPVNVAAPDPRRNADFVKELGRAIHRPTFAPFPTAAVRLVFGEMGEEVLLKGQRVESAALAADGFVFQQPSLAGALTSALRR